MASTDAVNSDEHEEVPLGPFGDGVLKIQSLLQAKSFNQAKRSELLLVVQSLHDEHLRLQERNKQLEASLEAANMRLKQKEGPRGSIANPDRTYSAVVSNSPNNKPTFDLSCTLRVFPKVSPDSGEPLLKGSNATKQCLRELKLAGAKVGVRGMKPIGKGGVSVLCRDQKEVEILSKAIESEQGTNLSVSKPKMRNPTFSFLLPGTGHDLAQVASDINSQNEHLSDADAFKLVHKFSTKANNTVVLLEASPAAYKLILYHDSKIYIGWDRVSLREQCPVSQCFKCFKYGHKARDCRFQVDGQPAKRCFKCGDIHDSAQCQATLCCSNCSDYNKFSKRGQPQHDTLHAANDRNCPMFIQAVNRAKMYINYA